MRATARESPSPISPVNLPKQGLGNEKQFSAPSIDWQGRGLGERLGRDGPKALLHQLRRGQDPAFGPPGQSFSYFGYVDEMAKDLLVVGGGHYFGNL